MTSLFKSVILLSILALFYLNLQAQKPLEYECIYTNKAPLIDGKPDDQSWQQVPWSGLFTDIEGNIKPAPAQDTRIKMLWDDQCLYILAELREANIWATLTQRESVIYHDNDFEVFLDPDGDSHHYFELEINALGTEWDLFLNRPYKDGGKAFTSWNIEGLRTAVYLQGSINNPADTDTAWFVEMAIPFSALRPYGLTKKDPRHLQVWRINFSRVQWQLDVTGDNTYSKRRDSISGKILPENNWVWSPQYTINMHLPETWGYLIFLKDKRPPGFDPDPDYEIKEWLHRYYYAQKEYRRQHHRYTKLDSLTIEGKTPLPAKFSIEYTSRHFLIKAQTKNGVWCIDHQARIWHEPLNSSSNE